MSISLSKIFHILSYSVVFVKKVNLLKMFVKEAFLKTWKALCVCMCVCVCVYVCVCVCACVCLRPFTVKASSIWISWTTREQINDVMLKAFIS